MCRYTMSPELDLKTSMKNISTNDAPAVVGHYEQGMISGGFVFVSGQVAVDPATGEKVLDSIEAQTEQALRNVEGVLRASGCELSDVVKLNVFLTGIEDWSKVDATIGKVMGDHRSARAIIPVGAFADGLLIEIDAIAEIGR